MDKKALEVLAGGRYLEDTVIHDKDRDPELEGHVRSMLHLIGEDPDREGLLDTPKRVSKAMHFLTGGYQLGVEECGEKCFVRRAMRRNGDRKRYRVLFIV